jgi:16S rRNA (guanine1207-N2)-methyltransferase
MSADKANRAPRDPVATLFNAYVATHDALLWMNAGFVLPYIDASILTRASSVFSTDRHVGAVRSAASVLPVSSHAVAGHGTYALPASADARTCVIRLPREKAAMLHLVHDAFAILPVGGTCIMAGATNEGIKSAADRMQRTFGNIDVLGRESSHRLVQSVKRTESPADPTVFDDGFVDATAFREIPARLRGQDLMVFTRPGVFSWDHLDEATEVLAGVMKIGVADSVLDLGCGPGALGVSAARLASGGFVTMVDADTEAVRCATRTAAAAACSNTRVLLGDVTDDLAGETFDVVITNPPFHSGRATDLDLPQRFIQGARDVLKPGGTLFLVANRTLPYEARLSRVFGTVASAFDGARFKVLTAARLP